MTGEALSVASVVRAARERQGWSARELSRRVDVSPAYVTKLEAGTVDPSLSRFARLARVLRLSKAEIYYCLLYEGYKEHDGTSMGTARTGERTGEGD